MSDEPEVLVTDLSDSVTEVTLNAPPNNLLTVASVRTVADAIEAAAASGRRAVVLGAAGKHFCTGMNLASKTPERMRVRDGLNPLYVEAIRLYAAPIPVVAAIQGAAIGGGLGLALTADFRVASSAATFAANFSRLGLHHGFGLTVSLPLLCGEQRALELLVTGRRVGADDARAIGLCDRVVAPADLLAEARAFADEIAGSAPLAVRAIRDTLRARHRERFAAAVEREDAVQRELSRTSDAAEGLAAAREKRAPAFSGT